MAHAPRASRAEDVCVVPAGECACIVRLGNRINLATHTRVLRLLRALDAAPRPGVCDLVPTYASLLIHFDPLQTTLDALDALVRRLLTQRQPRERQRGRLVQVPVRYGSESGPDLTAVAQELGLSTQDVIRLHASGDYYVYFLGFLAGFAYLGGLPAQLRVSRLPTPRTHVPAGSVAIAGQQAGVYSVDTPGGWRLIGWTPLRLFDPTADPPALLRPGDRVRFTLLSDSPDATMEALPTATLPVRTVLPREPAEPGIPWLRVLRPGPLTTTQDLGRLGFARSGVSASGAADPDALRLGNALLGNPPGAAALEVTLGGAVFEALAPCALAITGAVCETQINGRMVSLGTTHMLDTGDRLELGLAQHGVRTYLCVGGGVAVTPVLGSRCTDARAGLGGLEGRALRANDVLLRGAGAGEPEVVVGRSVPDDPVRRQPTAGDWRLRVLPGPHHTLLPGTLDHLVAGRFTVDPRSDRVGVRLRWDAGTNGAAATDGEQLSEGVPRGAVQLPPDGAPIVLLADHQTTGGYPIPAVVIAADRWRLAQLRPGDRVQLALVTLDEAVEALRERRDWLHELTGRWARGEGRSTPNGGGLDTAQLMRGFSEWSEETGDE